LSASSSLLLLSFQVHLSIGGRRFRPSAGFTPVSTGAQPVDPAASADIPEIALTCCINSAGNEDWEGDGACGSARTVRSLVSTDAMMQHYSYMRLAADSSREVLPRCIRNDRQTLPQSPFPSTPRSSIAENSEQLSPSAQSLQPIRRVCERGALHRSAS